MGFGPASARKRLLSSRITARRAAYLREVAHPQPRTNVIGAATRVRHSLAQAIHRFFDENGFFWFNTPIITASDAEEPGALFPVSTLDLANLPRTPKGRGRLRTRFLSRVRRS